MPKFVEVLPWVAKNKDALFVNQHRTGTPLAIGATTLIQRR
jgi:hypothetical protein